MVQMNRFLSPAGATFFRSLFLLLHASMGRNLRSTWDSRHVSRKRFYPALQFLLLNRSLMFITSVSFQQAHFLVLRSLRCEHRRTPASRVVLERESVILLICHQAQWGIRGTLHRWDMGHKKKEWKIGKIASNKSIPFSTPLSWQGTGNACCELH